ncbi:Fmp33 protein [Maudiozyma humilis]|uniref:Fmp33 protein n=1 Tax=Maudiozyma humilis TaxID=51915 RepID=A0AAV5RUV9_MAUHU|nr:Fmp33 protein [Kazachstania humilis]
MFATRLLFQAASKTKAASGASFSSSRANLISNAFITSLYSLGAWSIYKEVTTVTKFEDKAMISPPKIENVEQMINEAPNRIFKCDSKECSNTSEPARVLKSLTWGDLSQAAIGSGFLVQLSNIMHTEFGRKSFMYRASLGTTIFFPVMLYFAFRLRLKELDDDHIKIE